VVALVRAIEIKEKIHRDPLVTVEGLTLNPSSEKLWLGGDGIQVNGAKIVTLPRSRRYKQL
jgi:hypothetical protein